MEQGLIYTNDNCISCNKCVRVCTSPGASYVQLNGDSAVVNIDPHRCVSCGACFALCEHDAREYRDDTAAFFEDLNGGEPITVLMAPAFRAAYPREYAAILGGLKELGVRRIISVAFGADICTWACLKYMREEHFYGALSTPCPVAVSYVEHCAPELIPLLMPVKSPMLCAATYCREELGITDRLAFIGPCIGKKLETDAYGESPVHYNVTFLKLMEYVRKNGLYGRDASEEIEYGLGSFYPAPGGLADNLRWFLGDDAQVRVISGKTYLYGWINRNAHSLLERETPFLLIDALNCQDGCIEGTAGEATRFDEDRMFFSLQDIRRESKDDDPNSPWNGALTPEQRLEKLNERFKNLSLPRYLRRFTDRSAHCGISTPSQEEADRIFNEMHKTTPQSRQINCSACGYHTCYDMMVAIYNRFNSKTSCIHYEKDESLRLQRLSMYDQLTRVMNRNALQMVQAGTIFANKPIAIVAADINGLKEANDTLGHEAGDRLIVAVAECLASVFGHSSVYRTGGDEFIAVLQDHTEEECLGDIRRVRDALARRQVSAAIGYAFAERYEGDFARLQAAADRAMYADKAAHYRATGRARRQSAAPEPGEAQ